MVERGFHWTPATAGLFVPFEDGTSVQLWDDDRLCEEEIAPLRAGRPRGLAGVQRREAPAPRRTSAGGRWATSGSAGLRRAPRSSAGWRATPRPCASLFDWSMVEYVEHYFDDERLQSAYLGQGVIGTFASPHDPGTASIHFHHQSGRLGGMPGMWGYVEGGMGMVSFILCDIARDAGAVVLTGTAGGADHPGRGRRARGGRADRVAVRRLERRPADDAPPAGRRGRPRLASPGGGDPPGRLHGQAERRPARAAELLGAGRGRGCPTTSARSTRR